MKHRSPGNADVARALREMALFLEMRSVPFKPQAYEKAAYAVAALDRPLGEIYAEGGAAALDELPGIGKGIAGRIAGMCETGVMADLEELRAKTPVDILALTGIEGVGPKTVLALWEKLGIGAVADLKRAAKEGRIRELPHFGEKSEQRILEAIEFYEEAAGRRPLGEALEIARRIEAALAKVPGVSRASIAGSLRRHRDTIGDVDLLVAAESPARAADAFESLPDVQAVLARGPTKTLIRLSNGMDADLRVVAPESFGAALLYFTGSKAHNVALRRIAQKEGLKLNEYGLFRGEKRLAGRTEEEVYRALGLRWIPAEMREDTGEVDRSREGTLPRVLEAKDIRGDLQVHTNWTDGSATIEAMAEAARKLGLEYVVITDHTRDLAMTGGLTEARLRAQARAVRAADKAIDGIRVLAGAEVNIRPDGTLDVSEDVLEELDLVGAAIHSHFDQPRAAMTRRIVRAIENPRVDVLFHPLSRMLGRRRPVEVDFDAVIAACRRTGTILEIDAQPQRLDLPDTLARAAIEAGIPIAVDSDAHTVDELRFVGSFGVGVARRAWAEPRHVINTRPMDGMLAALKRRRPAHPARRSRAAPKPPAKGHASRARVAGRA